jgi:hypothetical protein
VPKNNERRVTTKDTANVEASVRSRVTIPAALLRKAIALLRFQIPQTDIMENKHLSQKSFLFNIEILPQTPISPGGPPSTI